MLISIRSASTVLRLSALTCFGLATIAALPAHAGDYESTAVKVEHVYAPKGFDGNDSAEVVVTGYLPNLCYKSPSVHATAQGSNIEVEVSALKQTTGNLCAQMAVPFMEVAALGQLPKGEYRVEANSGETAPLEIEAATVPTVDDHVYANVEYVERVKGQRKVKLYGRNPSPCYKLDHIEAISNGRDTYSVLPILKKVSDRCVRMTDPFVYEFDVPTDLTANELLLHVRITNGKSYNSLFTAKEAGETARR